MEGKGKRERGRKKEREGGEVRMWEKVRRRLRRGDKSHKSLNGLLLIFVPLLSAEGKWV